MTICPICKNSLTTKKYLDDHQVICSQQDHFFAFRQDEKRTIKKLSIKIDEPLHICVSQSPENPETNFSWIWRDREFNSRMTINSLLSLKEINLKKFKFKIESYLLLS